MVDFKLNPFRPVVTILWKPLVLTVINHKIRRDIHF